MYETNIIFVTVDQQHGGVQLITLYFSPHYGSLWLQNASALATRNAMLQMFIIRIHFTLLVGQM